METQFDIIWLILALGAAIGIRSMYRQFRYHNILRKRSHGNRPVQVANYIDLTTGGLRYGK